MIILYNVGDVELPYPVKFTHPVNTQEFLRDFILGLSYPIKFPHSIIFPYLAKYSICKSTYFFEINNIQSQK